MILLFPIQSCKDNQVSASTHSACRYLFMKNQLPKPMELTDILRLEATNRCHIYLYHHVGKVWGCCGRSALLLHQVYQNIPYRERDVSGNGDVLPVMVIDPMTLADLIERLPPIARDAEKMIFDFSENGK